MQEFWNIIRRCVPKVQIPTFALGPLADERKRKLMEALPNRQHVSISLHVHEYILFLNICLFLRRINYKKISVLE